MQGITASVLARVGGKQEASSQYGGQKSWTEENYKPAGGSTMTSSSAHAQMRTLSKCNLSVSRCRLSCGQDQIWIPVKYLLKSDHRELVNS